jgi:hypothetical protein
MLNGRFSIAVARKAESSVSLEAETGQKPPVDRL